MADFNSAFDSEQGKFENNNDIDYFFTQRKIVEYEEYIDDNMKRVKKKKSMNYNFLAINLPLISNNNLEIEIWGDTGYNYKGCLSRSEGTFPHLLIKLSGDMQLFVKLIVMNGNKLLRNFIKFIQIPKRYQSIPFIKEKKNNESDDKDINV